MSLSGKKRTCIVGNPISKQIKLISMKMAKQKKMRIITKEKNSIWSRITIIMEGRKGIELRSNSNNNKR